MKAFPAILLVSLLAACAAPALDADVTRFHDLPPGPPHQSFTVTPDARQAGALDFRHYAALVADAMTRLGFRQAPPGDAAPDLVVMLDYGNGGVRTETRSFTAPMFGPGPGPWPWGWNAPGWPAYEEEVYTFPTYAHFLEVDLLDGAALRAGRHQMVFQGRVLGEGPVRDLNVVMPAMVDAMFKGFPGANGRTVRVTIPIQ